MCWAVLDFSLQNGAYFPQVTAKYNLFTSLQKTETQAIREGLMDPEYTDTKSRVMWASLDRNTDISSEHSIQLLMEIYKLHENTTGFDEEEENSSTCWEKDPLSAGYTLKTFSEV